MTSNYRITYLCRDMHTKKTIHIVSTGMDFALNTFSVDRREKYSDAFRILECVFESLVDSGEFYDFDEPDCSELDAVEASADMEVLE